MGTHSLLRHRHCASSERFTTSNMKVAFLLVTLAALLAQSFGRNIFDKSKSMAHGWDISSSSDAYIASVKDALNQLEDDCPFGDQLEKDDCPFPFGDQLEEDDCPFPFGDNHASMAHGADISSSSDAYIAPVKDALNQLEEDDCPLGDQLEKDDCPFPIGDQLEKDDCPFPIGDQLEEDDCPFGDQLEEDDCGLMGDQLEEDDCIGDMFYGDNHAAEATQHKALTNAAVTAFLNNKPKLKKVLEDGEAAREHVRKLVKEALKKAKEAGYSITHTP